MKYKDVIVELVGHAKQFEKYEKEEKARAKKRKQENLKKRYLITKELRTKFLDKDIFKVAERNKYGTPTTLENTSNTFWQVYYKDVDITIVSTKSNNRIWNICSGKNKLLVADASAHFYDIIGKRMTAEKFYDEISSIKYGTQEKLGMKNCLNTDCLEYHTKGKFTTVIYKEFNDKGDFFTLKKIAMGKVSGLLEY